MTATVVDWAPGTQPDLETDVVVVGSGAAGFSAAITAQTEGADVILLEKAATLGGTTIKSSAWAWYPNHAGVQIDGHVDTKRDALEYMARLSDPSAYDASSPTLGLSAWRYEMLETFYEHAATAAQALHDAGVYSATLPGFPDYYSFLPENRTPYGRTLRPTMADGSPAGAPDMIEQAAGVVTARGGRILTEHPVRRLLLDDGEVVGVEVEHDGQALTVRARRGVVFASGGFGQDLERRGDLLAAPILGSCAAPGCTGDFITMAEELGAPLRAMTYPWMTLMVLEHAIERDPECKSLFHPPGDSMLFVNGDGERTLNEKSPYNETAQMLQRWDVRQARYPDLFQFMIWDHACAELHGNDRRANPIPPVDQPQPHVVTAPTLAELAERLRERVAELLPKAPRLQMAEDFADRMQASVARFNANAREGHDPDFGRGDTPIELAFNEMFTGGTRDERNPLLHPLSDEGPYYATIIVPAALDTKGGPLINGDAQVLASGGEPIPGLYGAGNCVAAPSGKSYWAAGATIGPAVTFGYLAGRHAAHAPVREIHEEVAA
jgi:3-oxosteroid 1-dehydrogenase